MNKNHFLTLRFCLTVFLLFACSSVFAQRNKDGNRRKPEGNRPSAASRPATRPAERPATRSESRPSERSATRSESRPSERPATRPATRPESRPSERPATRPATRPESRPSERPATRPAELRPVPSDRPRPAQQNNYNSRRQQRGRPQQVVPAPVRPYRPPQEIIRRAQSYYRDYGRYWTHDWYQHHNHAWYPYWIPAERWWHRPAWSDTWGWFGTGFFTGLTIGRTLTPYPYDYGNNIVYRGDMIYVNGVPYVSAAEYTQQARILAESAPIAAEPVIVGQAPETVTVEQPKTEDEFLPMGAFTVLDSKENIKQDILIQIAVNKKGQLRGNYSNEKDGTVRQFAGAVDSKSQRVALRFTDEDKKKERTVMECGLWNLTQDTVPFLVHGADEKTEQWTLIRLAKEDKGNDEGDELAP